MLLQYKCICDISLVESNDLNFQNNQFDSWKITDKPLAIDTLNKANQPANNRKEWA